jgi:arylsulfatase A-like enzyme
LNDPAATPRTAALTQLGNGYSIRTDRFRYTEWGPDGRLGNELYDHRTDPQEIVNLAGRPESAAMVAELSRLLRQRVADARRPPDGLKQLQQGAKASNRKAK